MKTHYQYLSLTMEMLVRISLFAFVTLLMVCFTACSVNPVTGDKEFSLLSAEQEVSIGQQNYGPYQQQQGGAYVVDPELTLYVKEIGLKLASVSHRPQLPFDFVVLNNDVPNAWALPGGKIAINRGLLILLDDEAQLAAVLGHEVVHATARHAAQQMTQQQVLGLSVAAAGMATASHEYGQYIGMGLSGGAALYSARYGRQQELQSDQHGIDYMVKAGYEPRAAVELQQTFLALSEGQQADFLSTLFASHPPSQERVTKNKAKTNSMAQGARYRERYQKAIAQIKKDEPAYKKQAAALQAANTGDLDSAQALLDQAIKIQPDEAQFYITKGQLYLHQKQYSSAKNQFQSAFSRNPDYYASSLGLGISLSALKQNAQAKPYLQKSVGILPTATGLFQLGEIAYQDGDKDTAAKYYQEVAQSGGELGQAATEKLTAMGYAGSTSTAP